MTSVSEQPAPIAVEVAALDEQLRISARAFDHLWGRLESLIAEARSREIHKAYGFKSWPDYIADVARTEMPNVARSVEQRRQVVALLAGEGMSQRAIADAVGVNHATISRDQAANEAEQVLHNATPEPVDRHEQMRLDVTPEPTTVVGRDGKQYPKPVNPNRNHAPRNTFSDKFYHALTKVQQGCNELQNLCNNESEKFAANRDHLIREHHTGIQWALDRVTEVLTPLATTNQGDLFGDLAGGD